MNGLLVATALLAYNNILNLWASFNRALYVPLNLAATSALLAVGLGPLGLDADAIGLGPDRLRGGGLGLLIGAGIATPMLLATLHARLARFVADKRVAGMSNPELAYQLLIRVPFGTALLEEVAFRGVLFAEWRSSGALRAAVWSSIAFGLWHISPTINLVRANRPGSRANVVLGAVAGAVAFTTGAGLLLGWLRIETGGLAAPLALHATVNGLGTVAAVLAARRLSVEVDVRDPVDS